MRFSPAAERCGEIGAVRGTDVLIIIIGLLLFVFVGMSLLRTGQARQTQARLVDELQLTSLSYRKGGFGTVMIADFSINNLSGVTVKDLKIQCGHFALSGTEVSHGSRTIYDVLPAHSARDFHDVNMGTMHAQAETARCQVTAAEVVP